MHHLVPSEQHVHQTLRPSTRKQGALGGGRQIWSMVVVCACILGTRKGTNVSPPKAVHKQASAMAKPDCLDNCPLHSHTTSLQTQPRSETQPSRCRPVIEQALLQFCLGYAAALLQICLNFVGNVAPTCSYSWRVASVGGSRHAVLRKCLYSDYRREACGTRRAAYVRCVSLASRLGWKDRDRRKPGTRPPQLRDTDPQNVINAWTQRTYTSAPVVPKWKHVHVYVKRAISRFTPLHICPAWLL